MAITLPGTDGSNIAGWEAMVKASPFSQGTEASNLHAWRAMVGGSADVKPEQIVRPAQSWQERYDQRIAELRAPPGLEEEDPELCIGGQNADSGLVEDDPIPGGGGFNTKDPEDEEEEKDPPRYTWTEVSRRTKKIRVENPEDPEQYVMVERIESMVMQAPDPEPFNGQNHTWVFRNR